MASIFRSIARFNSLRIRLLDDSLKNGRIEKMITHREEKWLSHFPRRAENGNAVLFLPIRI